MILKKVKIYNYRQLQKVELDLQNSLTVLAGPNNSGKTTLISVLKGMFRDKKLSFTYSDISTQHGVKGESHQSVVFVAADNYSTPNVRMYSFFELWSKNTFSLPEFEDLFYSYSKIIMEVEAKLRMKISDLTAETHNKNEANKKLLAEYSNQVLNTYRDNKLFEALLKDDFIAYLAKSTVGNAKNIFKISKIEGILTAYKLFYVGCSRARKNLVIVVDETKINKFENEFKAKLISIGFEIQGFPMQETATV